MEPQVQRWRALGVGGAVLVDAVLLVVTMLIAPGGERGATAGLLLAGQVAGVAVGSRGASGRRRTPMERLNDAAFVAVVAAVSLLAALVARPWTALLPGLVGGLAVSRAWRRAQPAGR